LNDLILGSAAFVKGYGVTNESKTIANKSDLIELAVAQGFGGYETSEKYFSDNSQILNFLCSVKNDLNIYLKFDVSSSLQEMEKFISAANTCNIKISILLHLTPGESSSDAEDRIRTLKSNFTQIRVGVSAVEVDQISDTVLGLVDIVQVPINPLDQRFANRLKDFGRDDFLIQARSVFLQGSLIDDVNETRQFKGYRSIKKLIADKCDRLNVNPITYCFSSVNFQIGNFSSIQYVVGAVNHQEINDLVQFCNEAQSLKLEESDLIRVEDPDVLDPWRWPYVFQHR